MEKMSLDRVAFLLSNSPTPCEYCIGTGLPEECEKDGIGCQLGIKWWLGEEAE